MKIQLRRFWQNTVLALVSIIFTLGSLIFLVKQNWFYLKGTGDGGETFWAFLEPIEEQAFFFFIFIISISYYFFHEIKKHRAEESIAATGKGLSCYYFFGILCLGLYIIVYSLASLTIYLLSCNYTGYEYVTVRWHVLAVVLLNLLLFPLLAVLAGAVLSFLKKPLTAYLLIFLFVILVSPFSSNMLLQLTGIGQVGRGIARRFVGIFDLYQYQRPGAIVASYGFPLLPYRFKQLGMHGFVLLALLAFIVDKRRGKRLRTLPVVTLLLSAVLFVSWLQPSSRLLRSRTLNDSDLAANLYYLEQDPDAPQAAENDVPFKILTYDLDLAIGDALRAKARVEMDQNSLAEYTFTLYHGYKVTAVLANGEQAIPFQQEGDYVRVDNRAGLKLDSLTMTYVGHGDKFFSNSQGVFLPGSFCYYPRAGVLKVYDLTMMGFERNYLAEEVDFKVNVRRTQEVFSNLPETEAGTFQGKSNGLTLVAGLYREDSLGDYRLIYPYTTFDEDISPASVSQLKDEVQAALNRGEISETQRSIFIWPDMHAPTVYEQIGLYSDHATMVSVPVLREFYVQQGIPSNRLLLFQTLQQYKEQPLEFKTAVAMENQMLANSEAQGREINYVTFNGHPALMLNELIYNFGADKVLPSVENYVSDHDDKRDYLAFVRDLDAELDVGGKKRSRIFREKEGLEELLGLYLEDPAEFAWQHEHRYIESLMYLKSAADDEEALNDPDRPLLPSEYIASTPYLLLQAFESYGDVTRERVEAYLSNEADTRSVSQFLYAVNSAEPTRTKQPLLFKRKLLRLLNEYLRDKAEFESKAEMLRKFGEMPDPDGDVAYDYEVYFIDKVKEYGDEAWLQEVNQYLYDDQDQRLVSDFIGKAWGE